MSLLSFLFGKAKANKSRPAAKGRSSRLHVEPLEDRLQPSSITVSGYVFQDANNNGIYDTGELPVANSNVQLKNSAGQVIGIATTNALGYYEFSLDYIITQVNQPPGLFDGTESSNGLVLNHPVNTDFIPGGNANFPGNNFGELVPASLSGFVYADANNDGVFQQGTESGISGATVTLTGTDDQGAAVNLPATTGAGGAYSFTNLRPGTYTITQTQPAGYLDGKDAQGTPGTGIPGNDVFSTITLSAGVNGINNNFGEIASASLSGFVYGDANNDGVFQGTESGISGTTIALIGINDLGIAVNTTTTTSASGAYSFTNLRPGTYTLTETQPVGYFDGKDTQGTPGTGIAGNDVFSIITLAAGVNGINNNFGEVPPPPASLAGFVYADTNNDGIFQQATESGIVGATVSLSGIDDLGATINVSTTTGGRGAYSFMNLRPGTYTITETQPTGYLDGKDTQGTPGTGISSNDTFSTITLVAGFHGSNNNFGELAPASLSGFVWADSSNNGIKDGGETGMAGVSVTLSGSNDLGSITPVTLTTNGSGFYEFTNLRPGTYTVTETHPAGVLDGLETRDNISAIAGSAGGADTISGLTLAAGGNDLNNNFGELLPATLSGVVYADANNNGIKDAAETTLTGVNVTLSGSNDLGTITPVTLTTNGNGFYEFTNLRPGTYTVTETQAAGFLDGLETRDNVTAIAGSASGPDTINGLTLVAGGNDSNNNFGEVAPAKLSGFVYSDVNNNGLKEIDEAPLSGVNVTLSGSNDLGTITPVTLTTNGSGFYEFTNLRPGTYTVTETQAAGFLDGLETRENITAIPGSAGGPDTINALTLLAGGDDTNNNFGELAPAKLSGVVYSDANNNGIKENDETPLAGVGVTLSGTNDLGTITPVTLTTNGSGFYEFTNLRPGTYMVTETQATGFQDGLDTRDNITAITGSAGGPDTINGLTLLAGGNDTNNNFGEIAAAKLSGFVYSDANNNGVKEIDEAALNGVSVTLTGTNDLGAITPVTQTTNGSGFYEFTNLRPGTYTVTETQATGFLDGLETRDNISAIAGSGGGPDNIGGLTLLAGGNDLNNNFGELAAAKLSGVVYSDANNNGIKDGNETPLSGVSVTLTGSNDLGTITPVTLTTNGSGFYEFTNLRPGNYSVTETQPAGVADGMETRDNIAAIAGSGGGPDTISGLILPAGGNDTNNNFGEVPPPATVSGFVYNDANNNGLFDGGETPLAGVSVTLTGSNDLGTITPVTQTTNGSGFYEFTNLRAGTYTVTETQAAGFLDGLETRDNATAIAGSAGGADTINGLTLLAGSVDSNNNFGEVAPAKLSGVVYADSNNNGLKEFDESTLAGVGVTLTGSNDLGTITPVTLTTNGSGFYEFTNLRPGTYTVTETQAAGFLDGLETRENITAITGSAGGPDTINALTLLAGGNDTNNNFGELAPAKLSGVVYSDTNNSGTKEIDEAPLSGVSVTLSGSNDLGAITPVTLTTNGSGFYEFTNLRPGTYTVTETQATGFLDGLETRDNITAMAGSAGGPDTINGLTLLAGGNDLNNNFGELAAAKLSGVVYADANNNGIKEANETPLSGVSVTLSGSNDLGPITPVTLTTNGSGFYEFTNLRPGTYSVTETQPAGVIDGLETRDNITAIAGSAGGSDTISGLTLLAGGNDTNNNFGEVPPPATVSGFVYNDANNNGLFDGGETPLAGVSVTLSGSNDLGTITPVTLTTNGSGFYEFTNLRPGTYTVTETQAVGFLDGLETRDNVTAMAGSAGGPDTINGLILVAGGNDLNNNFGEVAPARLSGTVYNDSNNNNGVFDGGETPLSGVSVTLSGSNDLGAITPVTLTTNGSGFYEFTNLRPGTYTVTETQAVGYLDGRETRDNITAMAGSAGGPDAINALTLLAGGNDVNNNFGELSPASLSGYVYADANNDGVFQGTENGITGITVTLTGTNDLGAAINLPATTGPGGAYSFTNLRPGTYILTETHPTGYTDGLDTMGTPGGTPGNDTFFNIVLAAGVLGANNNFGEGQPQTSDVGIVKTADPMSVLVGENFVYTLQVTNHGPLVANNVVVTDALPASVTYISAFGPGWQITQAGGTITAVATAPLPVGVTSQITITVKAPIVAGNVVNTAIVTTTTPDSNPNNNQSTVTVTVFNQPGDIFPKAITPLVLEHGPLVSLGKPSGTSTPVVNTNTGILAFIDSAYRTFTGAGASFSTQYSLYLQIKAGSLTREQLIAQLWNADAHRVQQATEFYQIFYRRNPTTPELNSLVNTLKSGVSEMDVAVTFMISTEYQQLHPTPNTLIAGFYQDVLGRLPDTSTLLAQVQALNNTDIATYARSIVWSTESLHRIVDAGYRAILRRPATTSEMQTWGAQLQARTLTPAQLMQKLMASEEFFQLVMSLL